jgi:hypothetical protein
MDALAWEMLIKPKVLNQPGFDPGIMKDARARLDRFLPVLDKQLADRDYIVGPLTVVDSSSARASTALLPSSTSTLLPTRTSVPGSNGSAPSPIGRTPEARRQRTPFFDFFTTSLPFAATVLASATMPPQIVAVAGL